MSISGSIPPRLQEIIDDYGVFADRSDLTAGDRVDLLRRSVVINWRTDDPGPTVIVVSATLNTPEHARFVAQELGHRLIKLSVHMRMSEAQATLDFLSKTKESKVVELSQVEARIAGYLDGASENADSEGRTAQVASKPEIDILEQEAARLRDEIAFFLF